MVAQGQMLQGIWFPPFSPYWRWEHPPINGHIVGMIEVVTRPATGEAKPDFRNGQPIQFVYVGDHLSQMIIDFQRPKHPAAIISFDSKGRQSAVVEWYSNGKTPNEIKSTQAVEFDKDGKLSGIRLQDTSGVNQLVKVKESALDTGGKTVAWDGPISAGHSESYTLTYDKADHLISITALQDGKPWHTGPAITYNDHGDIGRMEENNGVRGTNFEYLYDDHKNWTRRSAAAFETQLGQQLTSPPMVTYRQITYANGSGPLSKEAIPKAHGIYKAELGNVAADSFYSIMTLTLANNGKAILLNVMPDSGHPGQKIENKSEGSWKQADDEVTITLEIGNGQPIPRDDPHRVFTLKVSAGGDQLVSDNLQFKKQK